MSIMIQEYFEECFDDFLGKLILHFRQAVTGACRELSLTFHLICGYGW